MRYLPALLLLLMIQACSTFQSDPTKDWTAKDFYDEADEALYSNDFETAIKHLETLEARYPFDPYAKQAQLNIAYSYYKFDEPDAAISAADRFLRLHPRDPNIDYVYYLKGMVNFKRGTGLLDNWFKRDKAEHDTETLHNSFNDFATLVRRYPDSKYAGDAYQRMVFLRNELAQHEIDVAEYYLSRKAWLGAANRAKTVIERYENSTSRNRALEIMVTAYTELGLDNLATDAQRILDMNQAPASNVTELDSALDKPPTSWWQDIF